MAREEDRWCFFSGADARRGPSWIPMLFVLCTLLVGSLAVAGECTCVCAFFVGKYKYHACVRMCVCAYVRALMNVSRPTASVHGRLSITCCISRRILLERIEKARESETPRSLAGIARGREVRRRREGASESKLRKRNEERERRGEGERKETERAGATFTSCPGTKSF